VVAVQVAHLAWQEQQAQLILVAAVAVEVQLLQAAAQVVQAWLLFPTLAHNVAQAEP
jgi:hypothetical protein